MKGTIKLFAHGSISATVTFNTSGTFKFDLENTTNEPFQLSDISGNLFMGAVKVPPGHCTT